MKIRPLGKRVLIKEVIQEEITKSGIVLPGTVEKEKQITGEVLEIGSEITEVSVGDTVIYEKYAGTEVKDGELSLLIVDIENILAVVEQD